LRHRALRAAKIAAATLLALFSVYVVAINVFLSSSLFERIVNTQDPESILIGYERAWSVWPGRIHTQKLWIRSSDSKVEWILRLDRCTFDVSFVDLALKKMFHTSHVTGEGISFRIRERLDGPLATPEYVDALPPVPGFDRIPFKLEGPPDDADVWDDSKWKLWTIHLEDIDARAVREVWINSVRYEGDTRITGRFFFRPIRRVDVGWVDVATNGGRARIGERTLLDEVSGTMRVRAAPFDPRYVRQTALLGQLSATTSLRGRTPDLAALPTSFLSRARVTGPAEVRALDVHIEEGRVTPGSHVDILLPHATVDVVEHHVEARVEIHADSVRDGTRTKATLRLEARDAAVARLEPEAAAVARVPLASIEGDAFDLDLQKPTRGLHVAVDARGADMPNASVIMGYLRAEGIGRDGEFAIEGGHAHADAHVDAWLDEERAKGHVALRADDLDLRLAKVRVRGRTNVDAGFEDLRWREPRMHGAALRVHVAEGAIARKDTPTTPLVVVRGFDIAANAPTVDLADPLRGFRANLDMAEGEIVDRGLLHAYLPKGHAMEVVRGHARFALKCDVAVEDHRASGNVELRASRFGLTLDRIGFAVDVAAHARVANWDWPRGDLSVDDATVEATKLEATIAEQPRPALTVPRIVVRASSDRFSLSDPMGHVRLHAAVEDARITDAAVVDAFLPPGSDVKFAASEGRFSFSMDASVDDHIARGKVTALARNMGARTERVAVRGDVDLAARVSRWDLDRGTLAVDASKLVLDRVSVRFDGDEQPSAVARQVELSATTASLDLAHLSLRGADVRLAIADAEMADARTLSRFLGTQTRIEGGRARVSGAVHLSAPERRGEGGFRVLLENASVRSEKTVVAGHATFDVRVHGFDPDRSVVDLAGSTLALRDVRVTGASLDTQAWRGDITVASGDLSFAGIPRFEGLVQLHADNAAPFLGLAFHDDVPGLIAGLLRAPGLSGQARVTGGGGEIAITDAHVRGGDVDIRGDLVSHAQTTRGAFVLAKGPLSAGLKVENGATFVRLWGIDSWSKVERRAVAGEKAKADAEAAEKAKR